MRRKRCWIEQAITTLYFTVSKISTKNLKIMNPINEIMHLKSFKGELRHGKPDAMRISAEPTTPATKRCSTIKVHRGIIAGKRRDQTPPPTPRSKETRHDSA